MFAVRLLFIHLSSRLASLVTCLNRPPQPLVPSSSVTFVSQASIDNGTIETYHLKKRVEAVKHCRKIGKKDMKFNQTMPKMKVDPERYVSEEFFLFPPPRQTTFFSPLFDARAGERNYYSFSIVTTTS